jgi:hypothetical protein
MQFSPELREGVAAGRITLTYRLWTRPQVREGGRYAVAGAHIDACEAEHGAELLCRYGHGAR